MALKPEVSLPTSLATAAIVWAIYDQALPNLTDVRAAPANDTHVNSAERLATWTSLGVVGAISLIAHDPNVFIVGAGLTVTLAWWHRHANAVDPSSGHVPGPSPVRTPDMYAGGPVL
jgi:hypothetical protein